MKIYIKYHNENCKLESFGNWIDLKSAETVTLKPLDFKLINLGLSMRLPKWYQANIVPRSSTYKKFGIIQANHYGVVDGPDNISNGYSGNGDVYMMSVICLKDCQINEGDRICQFEIRLSMKAPWYTKLKWLLDSKITFIEVDDLKTNDRGGFGTSNK